MHRSQTRKKVLSPRSVSLSLYPYLLHAPPHRESSKYLQEEFLEEKVIETEVLDEEAPEEVLQLVTNDLLQSMTSRLMEQVPRANWQTAIDGVVNGGGGCRKDLPAATTNDMGCLVLQHTNGNGCLVVSKATVTSGWLWPLNEQDHLCSQQEGPARPVTKR